MTNKQGRNVDFLRDEHLALQATGGCDPLRSRIIEGRRNALPPCSSSVRPAIHSRRSMSRRMPESSLRSRMTSREKLANSRRGIQPRRHHERRTVIPAEGHGVVGIMGESSSGLWGLPLMVKWTMAAAFPASVPANGRKPLVEKSADSQSPLYFGTLPDHQLRQLGLIWNSA